MGMKLALDDVSIHAHQVRRLGHPWLAALADDRLLAGVAHVRGDQLLEPGESLLHLLVDPVGLLVEVGDLELGLEVDLVLDVAPDPVARRGEAGKRSSGRET